MAQIGNRWFRLDMLVLTTHQGPKTKGERDGTPKNWYVYHIDGNAMNCHPENLRWESSRRGGHSEFLAQLRQKDTGEVQQIELMHAVNLAYVNNNFEFVRYLRQAIVPFRGLVLEHRGKPASARGRRGNVLYQGNQA